VVATVAQSTFRLLGELEVESVPRARLGGPKQRALLAYLLLHANELVPRDRLVDAVWGANPPPTARSIVHGYVRKLRAALEGTGARIAARSPGYVLELDLEELDVRRFERLVQEGREALVMADPERARALLTDALALWRGEVFADLVYEPSLEAEARRLEELRLEATMARIEAELALGANGALVGELESLVSRHPFRERLREQLMLALYRAGRQADALDSYQATRATLAEQLGIDPGPNLQQLEGAILRHDSALEIPGGVELQRAPVGRVRIKATLALALLFVAAAAVTVAVVVPRAHGRPVLVAPNSLGVIDPRMNKLVGQVRVGTRPGPVAAVRTGVWVANLDDETLSRIDPRTRSVVRTIPLNNVFPSDLAVGEGTVWVADGARGTVVRVSRALDRVAETTPVGCPTRGVASSASIAVGEGGVWFVCGVTLARIDPTTNRPTMSDYTVLRPSGIAVGLGAVWVSNAGEDTISRVDPVTGRITRTLNVASEPRGLAVGSGAVWAAAFRGDAVSRLSVAGPGLPISSESIPVGDGPLAVAIGEDAIWVANSGDGTVSRIDPRTRTVVATIRVGNRPVGIAAGGGLVWVTVQAKEKGGLG
jgi:YVTN family beta-propeller protein